MFSPVGSLSPAIPPTNVSSAGVSLTSLPVNLNQAASNISKLFDCFDNDFPGESKQQGWQELFKTLYEFGASNLVDNAEKKFQIQDNKGYQVTFNVVKTNDRITVNREPGCESCTVTISELRMVLASLSTYAIEEILGHSRPDLKQPVAEYQPETMVFLRQISCNCTDQILINIFTDEGHMHPLRQLCPLAMRYVNWGTGDRQKLVSEAKIYLMH